VNHSSSLVSESSSGLDHANNQKDFLAEGLTTSCKSVLHNPVLPLAFDLFNPVSALNQKRKFAHSNRTPFAEEAKL